MDKRTAKSRTALAKLHHGECGAVMVEMVIKISLIAIVCMPALATTGLEVANRMCNNAVKVAESEGGDDLYGQYNPSIAGCETCRTGWPGGCLPS